MKIYRLTYLLGLAFVLAGFLSACRKKPLPVDNSGTTPPVDSSQYYGEVEIRFKNYVGEQPMSFDVSDYYTLPNGDQMKLKVYNYYVSNIVLVAADGTRYYEPESYHLIMQRPALVPGGQEYTQDNFELSNIPAKKYVAIEFLIGVDSTRNVSGAQSGSLDPKYGMFWTWSSGYIMAKLEGESPQSTLPDGSIAYHIGGFKGEYNVLRSVRLDLPLAIELTQSSPHSLLTLKSDAAQWFDAKRFDGFSVHSFVSAEGKQAMNIASNYSEMFSVLSVENR